MKGKTFKVDKLDDTFFKDKFDCSEFEDNIYNQMANTMAKNVDIDLAKTPLVDILTGYTRYKTAEVEVDRLNNIINELEKYLDEALGQDMYRYDFYIILKKLKELKEGDK